MEKWNAEMLECDYVARCKSKIDISPTSTRNAHFVKRNFFLGKFDRQIAFTRVIVVIKVLGLQMAGNIAASRHSLILNFDEATAHGPKK